MAIGMSVGEFYNGHVWLAAAYKRANRIRRDQANFDAYLQGTYFFEAMSTVMANAFSKKRHEWRDSPYELRRGDQCDNIDDGGASKGELAGIAFMEMFMARHNAKFSADGPAEGTDEDDEVSTDG